MEVSMTHQRRTAIRDLATLELTRREDQIRFEEEGEPGGRAPAPLPLRFLQAFLNSHDIEGARDAFATVSEMQAWLVERELIVPPATLDESARVRAVMVREAVRALLIARDGHGADVEATRTVEQLSRAIGVALRLGPDRWDFVAADDGSDAIVATILGDVARAMADGSWGRLKACHRDACQWVYWDASRNRSARWCTMSICGNRAKGAAFRTRVRTVAEGRPAFREDIAG
jgi:predicted RNA-binding Zn ribbon-like protein